MLSKAHEYAVDHGLKLEECDPFDILGADTVNDWETKLFDGQSKHCYIITTRDSRRWYWCGAIYSLEKENVKLVSTTCLQLWQRFEIFRQHRRRWSCFYWEIKMASELLWYIRNNQCCGSNTTLDGKYWDRLFKSWILTCGFQFIESQTHDSKQRRWVGT